MLSETGSLLQWGDKLSPTLWLRSIGFHSALCSLCTTAVKRESIKTSQVHYTTSNPYPYWFHTHGSAMPKHDYALQFGASMTILSDLDVRTGEKHVKSYIYESLRWICYFSEKKLQHTYIFSPQWYILKNTEYPVVLRPLQPHYEIVLWCQSLSRVRWPIVQCLMPVGAISPSAECITTILCVTYWASALKVQYWGSKKLPTCHN